MSSSPTPKSTGRISADDRNALQGVAMKREVIVTPGAPAPLAHYCQGVLAGDTLYAAGQIASDYKTGVAPEARQDPAFPYYGSNIQKQARYILQNLRRVFEAAGCSLADVVKSQ